MSEDDAAKRETDGRLGVLIVEDDYILALDLERLVSRLGHSVLDTFATAARAMDYLRERRPDLVLLDVALYDGYGSIIAAVLREMRIPFILVTGQDAEFIEDDPALRGAPYLRKPFDEQELAEMIATLAGRSGASASASGDEADGGDSPPGP